MSNALVIEENKLISWSLKEILVEQGFKTLVADSYELALDIAEKIKFHLIIVDYEQSEPEKIEAIKKIHALQLNASLLILSAESQSQVKDLLPDIATLNIIEKPFQAETIHAVAKAAMEIK